MFELDDHPALYRGWRAGLLRTRTGQPHRVLANAMHALRSAPVWSGVIRYNEFALQVVADGRLPWAKDAPTHDLAWTDHQDSLTAEWLQREGIHVGPDVAGQAVEAIARDAPFHPVRDYLSRICWDGVPRLDAWLSTYLGVADTPYARAVGSRWMISAVARVFMPGAKADCVLILEGPQGIKKSTALSVLGGPWFADRLSDLTSKDAAMETAGAWIIEIAELDSMSRAEVSTVKAFVSRTHDRFRPPYARRLTEHARQCVFAGSVNPEGGYLKDATGARRFWPVRCQVIDVARLAQDRDQLWAEATARFRAGEPWWLDSAELNHAATEEQAERYQEDAWEGPISEYLNNQVTFVNAGFAEPVRRLSPRSVPLNEVGVDQLLKEALGIPPDRWTQRDQNRVARCLVALGFERFRPRGPAGSRQRKYRRRSPG